MAVSTSEFSFYHYDPTSVGAIIFIILFFLTTILHFYQLLRTRSWFMIPMVVGGCLEWIGYIGRTISHTQTPNWTLGPYIIQTLFLLVAPALFAASIYMELGKIIILADGESHALIKKKWLTKFFVCGDIISFFAQGAGGGIQASGTSTSLATGSHIIIGGLFIQLLFFGCFMVVAIHFNIAMHKIPTSRALSHNNPWRRHLVILYAASFLIMIRSIFRVVEYLQGFNGYILSHEIFLYFFDAVLILFVMVLLNVVHPSEVVALVNGGKAAKMGVKMEIIKGHHQSMMSESSTNELA